MTEVREVARIRLPTVSGEFGTRAFGSASGHVYLAMVKGEIGDGHEGRGIGLVDKLRAYMRPAGHHLAAGRGPGRSRDRCHLTADPRPGREHGR